MNLVLQGGVPMPQTPFLGVLGLSYVQQSCLEGHAGPKSASKGKSPLMVIVAVLGQRVRLTRGHN